MKSILLLFVFTIIFANIGIIHAFAAEDPITVTTDKSSYLDGDTIVISGKISDYYSGAPVSLIIKSPNGNLVSISQITVNEDKKYSTQIIAGGLMKSNGTYSIAAQYWIQDRYAETFFEFGNSPVIVPSIEEPDYSIPVIGWDNFIKYEITGGKLLSITADRDKNGNTTNSLIISVDAINDGSLILTIPRSVADYTIDGIDGEFIILIDGETMSFDETKSSTDRTLVISFPAETTEIKIIGTHVVPEFGFTAMMILVVSVISMVIITTKSGKISFE